MQFEGILFVKSEKLVVIQFLIYIKVFDIFAIRRLTMSIITKKICEILKKM